MELIYFKFLVFSFHIFSKQLRKLVEKRITETYVICIFQLCSLGALEG